MNEFIAYMRFGFGVRRASYLAWGRWKGWRRWQKIFNAAVSLLAALLLLAVYCLVQWVDDAPVATTHAPAPASLAYTKALEKLAVTCLSPGESWVKVGDENWLVGAYKL